jgi:hypothetical protein
MPEDKPEPRVRSFLKSTTGLVTATATLVAAIAGLITALTQLGGSHSTAGGAPGTTSTTSTTTAPLVLEDASARELYSHIPASIQSTCTRPTTPEETAAAAINCSYRYLIHLQYNLFASSRELEADYRDVKKRFGVTPRRTGSCARGPFEGRFAGGHLLCFLNANSASIVWTTPKLQMMSFAWRDDPNLPALYDAWRQQRFGPKA